MSLAVVGADHLNKSGPTRRFEIAMCVPGEPVELVPEPKNPADPQAIAVMSERGIQLGYVRAERCQLIHTYMRRGPIIAIFQRAEAWGATIRLAFDGEIPEIPEVTQQAKVDEDHYVEPVDFWPDEEWPDE